MKRSLASWLTVMCAIAALLVSLPASAEEIEKKFRASLSIGQYDTRSALNSDSANILSLVDAKDQFVTYIEDPRNDNAALGNLGLRPANRIMATAQYGLNRFFLVEGSVGYEKGDVGSIEMQAEFLKTFIQPIERHKYTIYNLKAGTITKIPVQLTGIARFRPKARLNPYLGMGFGYAAVGFAPSDDLNTLSARMDGLVAGQSRLDPYPATVPNAPVPADFAPMSGATVSADNYWEWHIVGGMEYSVKRKWTVYGDVRYESASNSYSLSFNGSDSVGISVPNRQALRTGEIATAQYGPMVIPSGGLVDGGLLVNPDIYNSLPQKPGVCDIADPSLCTFLRNMDMADYNETNKDYPEFVPVTPDGVTDPGYYYVKGGSIRYSGLSLQIGVRYAF